MKINPYLREIGQKIKRRRKAQRLTLDQMAGLSGVNVTAISFLENGRSNPHLLTLKAITDVLGADLKEFL